MGIFDKIREGLKKTRDNISGQITQMVNSFTKIDEELFEELEELLVMGDVGVNTAGFICDRLRQRIKEKGITDPSLILGELKSIVSDMLQGDNELHISTKPSIILVIGVNGVGKTTTIGKLASRLKGEGRSVILGAADTFRAAAIEQLEVWAERAGVPLIKHKEGGRPCRRGVRHHRRGQGPQLRRDHLRHRRPASQQEEPDGRAGEDQPCH